MSYGEEVSPLQIIQSGAVTGDVLYWAGSTWTVGPPGSGAVVPQATGGTGTATGAGAGSIALTSKSSSFTAAVATNYVTTAAAGQGIFMTLPSASAGDEIVVFRAGIGACLVEACTLNGVGFTIAALRRGVPIRFRYVDGTTGWVCRDTDVGGIPSTGAQFLLTAQRGITESSGAVSQWDDQSSNAAHVSQSGAGKPTYSTTGLTNHPGVTFAGGSSQLLTRTDEAWMTLGASVTTVWMLKPTTSTGHQTIVSHGSGTTGFSIPFGNVTSRKQSWFYGASTVTDSSVRLYTTEPMIAGIRSDGTDSEFWFYDGGVPWIGSVKSSGTVTDSALNLGIGGVATGSFYLSAVMGGISIHNTKVSDRILPYIFRFYQFSSID